MRLNVSECVRRRAQKTTNRPKLVVRQRITFQMQLALESSDIADLEKLTSCGYFGASSLNVANIA